MKTSLFKRLSKTSLRRISTTLLIAAAALLGVGQLSAQTNLVKNGNFDDTHSIWYTPP